MHILYLITKSEVGGAQRSVLTLAESFSKLGHNVTIGTGSYGYLTEMVKNSNINIQIFNRLKRTENPITNLLFILELWRYLHKNKVDIIHFNSSNTLFGLIALYFIKTKPRTIFTYRGLSFIDPHSTTPDIKKFFYRQFFRFFSYLLDASVFVCESNRKWAIENKIVGDRSVTIYNALNTDNLKFLSKETAKEKIINKLNLQIPNNSKFIGTIGRLSYPKNQIFLIQALAKKLKNEPNLYLLLIGDGSDYSSIREEVAKFEITDKVLLAGKINNGSDYIKAFDVFLLPSIYEGLPLSVIECMHAQIPVLVTNVGGNNEILPKEMIYETDNIEEFLMKLDNIFTNHSYPTLPEKLQLSNMIKNYTDIYQTKIS